MVINLLYHAMMCNKATPNLRNKGAVGQSPSPIQTGARDMSLRLGDVAPDFEADSTEGKIRFHDWIGDNWAVLFSHPKDFTPVCTTELGYMAKLQPELKKRNVKIIGLSVDSENGRAAGRERM